MKVPVSEVNKAKLYRLRGRKCGGPRLGEVILRPCGLDPDRQDEQDSAGQQRRTRHQPPGLPQTGHETCRKETARRGNFHLGSSSP